MGTNEFVIRKPDQRLRVFVSSTLQELAEERAAARQAVTSLRLAPVMFDLGARPHPPRDLYRAYLDQSHIFIGIYWQRYGWVAPGESISGLEDEYRLSGDKPKLIYVKSPAQEREFPVLPLALPDSNRPLSIQELSRYEAISLFVQRARDVKLDFALTDENTPVMAEISQRLDGLPLAIELAAARIKMLPPQALLTRLDSRLALLTGGARDLPVRQQTLRNTVEWSYDLVDENEKVLFRRLAVFAGGCTLEAAEEVCNAAGDLECDILEAMTSLVDESLLRQGEGVSSEPRFWMLQTIREYGLERLTESGEAAAIQRRHADFFLALAEQVESKLRSGQRDSGLRQLEAEHDNLRAALAWSQTAEDSDIGLQLAGALSWFWYLNGHWSEGRSWLEGALARIKAGSPAAARAKALFGVGMLAAFQYDGSVALLRFAESIALFREIGDKLGLAYSLAFQGTVMTWHGNFNSGRAPLMRVWPYFGKWEKSGGWPWHWAFWGMS